MVEQSATDAPAPTPHRLIQLLFKGLYEHLSAAQRHLIEQQIQSGVSAIDRGISVLAELRRALDLEAAEDMKENIQTLCDFLENRLLKSRTEAEPGPLKEALELVATVGEGLEDRDKNQPENASGPLISSQG